MGRIAISVDDATRSFLRDICATKGFPTMSKFIMYLIEEYKAKLESKEPSSNAPKTDKERFDAIVEEIGKMNEENHVKFEVIRLIIPGNIERPPEKESEVEPFIRAIWEEVVRREGHYKYRNKEVAISRADLKKYARLNRLVIEKDELSNPSKPST